LEEVAATVDVRLNKDKIKLMKVKKVSPQMTKEPTEEVKKFTYLGT